MNPQTIANPHPWAFFFIEALPPVLACLQNPISDTKKRVAECLLDFQDEEFVYLSPVYTYHATLQGLGGGKFTIVRTLLPFHLYDVQSLAVKKRTIVTTISLADLTPANLDELRALMDPAEVLRMPARGTRLATPKVLR